MIILGIDPGTATTGYGAVHLAAGQLGHLGHGSIRTPATRSLPERLRHIYDEVNRLMDRYNPDVVAVEQLFFSRNVTSAFSVGHARGVHLLAAAQRGIHVVEYTPMQVKQGVCGYGGAQKAQIAFMVRALLGLDHFPRPDDAADALAIAICHGHSVTARGRIDDALQKKGVTP